METILFVFILCPWNLKKIEINNENIKPMWNLKLY